MATYIIIIQQLIFFVKSVKNHKATQNRFVKYSYLRHMYKQCSVKYATNGATLNNS